MDPAAQAPMKAVIAGHSWSGRTAFGEKVCSVPHSCLNRDASVSGEGRFGWVVSPHRVRYSNVEVLGAGRDGLSRRQT